MRLTCLSCITEKCPPPDNKEIFQIKNFLKRTLFVLSEKVKSWKDTPGQGTNAWDEINFHKNNLWNILVIGNYFVNFQNYQNVMLLSSSDTRQTSMHASILVYKFHPERTGLNMHAEYMRLQLTFLALVSCPWPLKHMEPEN